MTKPTIVYLGTPNEAVPPLRALHAAGYPITMVVTRADARRARRGKPAASPVKAAAEEMGLKVVHTLDAVASSGATLGVVVAYGRIIPAELLTKVPMVNLHFSLLPRWRGAAPVERAILAGDRQTAVAIMGMEAGLDTGPIYAETILPIRQDHNAETLREELVAVGTELLIETLNGGLTESPRVQEGEAVYASKITAEDRTLRLAEGTEQVVRRIRIGRAWTTFAGQRFIIWAAEHAIPGHTEKHEVGELFGSKDEVLVQTGDGIVKLLEVQPAGKARVAAGQWWNGAQPAGEKFTDPEPYPPATRDQP